MPLVASHWYHRGFQERFDSQATADYTPYCVAPTALKFLDSIGGLVCTDPAPVPFASQLTSYSIIQSCIVECIKVPLKLLTDGEQPITACVLYSPKHHKHY